MIQQVSALSGKRVVCIGAGTGQANILRALASGGKQLESLIGIVSVTDNGGHSGVLRTEFHIPQVGDGKQCLLALAPESAERDRLARRNSDGTSPANTVLARLTKQHGIARAFDIFRADLACQGQVLPATESNVHIRASLEDGSIVTGEWEVIKRDPRIPINQMSLSADAPAYPGSLEAIRQADVIIIAPGSFHTGLVSALLPTGMREAFLASDAQVIQVINLMTQPGLTDDWDAEQHVRQLNPYLGREPDVVIVNSGSIPEDVLQHYGALGSEPVIFNGARQHFPQVRFVELDLVPSQFSGNGDRPGTFAKWTHLLTHSSGRLLAAIEAAVDA